MTTATARTTPRGRRQSLVPGFYTRAQVEADLALTGSLLYSFEQAGLFGPEQSRQRGDTRPVLYSSTDLAIGRFIVSAYRLGIRAEALHRATDALRLKRKRLVPGWSGRVVVDTHGDLELLQQTDNFDVYLRRHPDGQTEPFMVIPLSVPSVDAAGEGEQG